MSKTDIGDLILLTNSKGDIYKINTYTENIVYYKNIILKNKVPREKNTDLNII